MLFRPLLGAPFPVPSLSCFIFYTRWSVLRRSRCSKVPVSASLSKGRPDSLISILDSPLVGPPSPLAADDVSPLFARRSLFLVALCCLLWYWLGFYPKLQLTTTVSHKSLNNQIIETTFTLCSLPTSPS